MTMMPTLNSKCCNYVDNASPTLAQVKAIETEWNTFVNNFYNTVNAKYTTDLSKIEVPVVTVLRNADGTSQKHDNGDILVRTYDSNRDPVVVCREEINAMKLKSLLLDTGDAWVSHNIEIRLDGDRIVIMQVAGHHSIADVKDDGGAPAADPPVAADPDKVTTKGITTCIAAGKLTLRTHLGHYVFGDYVKKELIFDNDFMAIS